MLQLAGHQLVTPSLAAALARVGFLDALPEQVREFLEATRDLNRERNAKLRNGLMEVTEALNTAGIKPLILKGAIALVMPDYPGAEDRVVGDIDLLVPADRSGDAYAAVLALGYRQATEAWSRMLRRDRDSLHHLIPLLHPSLPVSVELHTRILHHQ